MEHGEYSRRKNQVSSLLQYSHLSDSQFQSLLYTPECRALVVPAEPQ